MATNIDIMSIMSKTNPANLKSKLTEGVAVQTAKEEVVDAEKEEVAKEEVPAEEVKVSAENKEDVSEENVFEKEDAKEDANPFSYKIIEQVSNSDKKDKRTIWLYPETFEMLDVIKKNSRTNVPMASIIHNLVSQYLKVNKERLRQNRESNKTQKKDYLA